MSTQSAARAAALAHEPMRTSGPRSGFASGTWTAIKDLWAHRELLGLLVRRELKARYKDSALGFFWSLMRPLTMLLIYWLAIGKFLEAERAIPSFAIYIFTGLTAWALFSEVVTAGTSSIVSNGGLIKKVYVPREIFPLSTTGSALFNFGVQLVVLVIAVVVSGIFSGDLHLDRKLLYVPLAFAVLLVFALALALVLSAVNVYLRDVQYLVEISIMVLFWISPIVYSWEQVSGALARFPVLAEIYLANPVTLAVLGFQQAFWHAGADKPVPDHLAGRLGIALAVSVLLLWAAQRVFTRLQANFAQEL